MQAKCVNALCYRHVHAVSCMGNCSFNLFIHSFVYSMYTTAERISIPYYVVHVKVYSSCIHEIGGLVYP